MKKNNEINIVGWNTSDQDEIARRVLRGQTDKFKLENLSKRDIYFSRFSISSQTHKIYHVEIRSLNDLVNSCDCPDYLSNQLGTCKHIEHVLFRLKKLGVKKFKQAQQEGSPRVEIFLDTRKSSEIKIIWPKRINVNLRKILDQFFSIDGTLIGDPVITFPMLQRAIVEDKKWGGLARISRHIEHFIEYQKRLLQKNIQKEVFLADVKLGKKTLNVTKFPLHPYQIDGMLHLAFNERVLLADEMGLGKTVQAIAACELLRLNKHIKRVLIIATASLKAEWEEQIAKFIALPVLIIQGSRADRLKQYQRQAFFYITNYEQIVMDAPDIQRLLAPDVIVVDEAQRIKNWQTKTANAVKSLKSRYAFVLTGTPLENRIDDIYSIVQFLDPHLFGPLFRFNRDFYELDDKGKPIGYKNLDELHRRLLPIMLRRCKSDVEAELPERMVSNYFVSMADEQRFRYNEYKDLVARLVAQAKKRPLRKEEFEKLQRWLSCMRMLCDTPFILDGSCDISPKLSELENILEELLEDGNAKIIIFSEWERMLLLVHKLAKKNNLDVAWHTGSVPQQKRREQINRFKQDPNCRLFLSTDAGSVGLNLQVANIVINLDLPWNPAKLEQRIARAWRKHQTRKVQVINMICEDSIEHRMLSLLEQKQTLSQTVLHGDHDLKEMKLPSGRIALMERMESLMGSVSPIATPICAPSPVAVDPIADLRTDLLTEMSGEINILKLHQNKETGKETLLAVVNNLPAAQEQLNHQFPDKIAVVQLLDQSTFEAIQRLVDAGVVTLNAPLETLYSSEKVTETRKLRQEKNIKHANKYLEQTHRKQRMARLLIDGDFYEESIIPLKESLEAAIQAFAWLVDMGEQNDKTILTDHFINEHLIEHHGFPQSGLLLLNQLNNENKQNCVTQIQSVVAQHDQVLLHVEELRNKILLG